MSSTTDGPTPRDLGGRLTVFGILVVMIGGMTALAGLLAPLATRLLAEPDTPPLDWRSVASAVVIYSMLGAVLIWAGVGSIRQRRWVRSIMLTIGWSWLLFGLMSLLMTLGMLDRILEVAQSDEPLPPELAWIVKLVMLGLVFALGVAFPALLIVAYRDRDVLATCMARHPRADWSENLPPTVMGLGAGWSATAVLGLPMALQPAVPLFGGLVTGWIGTTALLIASVLCAFVAREVFCMRPAGWWGSTAMMILMGVSMGWTFARVEVGEFLRAMNYPEEQVRMMAISRSWMVGATMVLTLLSLVYMGAIRHHFTDPGARD